LSENQAAMHERELRVKCVRVEICIISNVEYIENNNTNKVHWGILMWNSGKTRKQKHKFT